MTYRCEALGAPKPRSTADKVWGASRQRCKRSATITVRGQHFCEQHAKRLIGMAADVRLSARDAL